MTHFFVLLFELSLKSGYLALKDHFIPHGFVSDRHCFVDSVVTTSSTRNTLIIPFSRGASLCVLSAIELETTTSFKVVIIHSSVSFSRTVSCLLSCCCVWRPSATSVIVHGAREATMSSSLLLLSTFVGKIRVYHTLIPRSKCTSLSVNRVL